MNRFIQLLMIMGLTHSLAMAQTCICDVLSTYNVGSSHGKEYLSTSGMPTNLDNTNIYVCGRFVIDDNFNFFNGNIYMNAEAEIVVESSNRFQLFGANIMGCVGMWKRILVEDGASMHSYNSTIYDSYHAAVELEKGSNGFYSNNTFDRNYISILVPDGTPSLHLAANTFNANQFTLSFPTGIPKNNANYPWVGIDCHNSSATIGIKGNLGILMSPNVFNGPFFSGVRTHQSIVHSYNNRYENINRLLGTSSTYSRGFGISASDRSLIRAENNDFEKVVTGLNLNTISSIHMEHNYFEDFFEGVFGIFESPSYSNIINNQFGTATVSGNAAVNITSNINGNLNTTQNVVFTDPRDGFRDHWGDFGISHSGEARSSIIQDNDITMVFTHGSVGRGIISIGNSGSKILGNTVNVKDNYENNRAITLFGTRLNQLEENNLFAESKDNNVGIWTENAIATFYCCNTDSSFNLGMHFTGMNDDSHIGTSILEDCDIGIEVADGTTLGIQNLTGNRWIGTFGTFGARNNNTDNFLIRASKFWVPDLDQQEGPGTHTPNEWFDEDPLATDDPCQESVDNCFIDGGEEPSSITPLDTLFVDGYLDTILGDGYLWTIKQELYTKVNEVSGLYGDNDDVDTWFDNQSNGVVEDYYLKRDSILSIFDVSALFQNSIDNDFDTLDVYFEQLAEIDSAIATDTFPNWPNYRAERLTKMEDIDSVYNDYLSDVASIKSSRKTAAQALLTSNGLLSTPDQPTKNEREYHNILLSTVASGVDTFTNAQKDSLYNIAMQCPDDGGRAVYWAAGLYMLVDDTVRFDFEANCNSGSQLVVYPNDELVAKYKLMVTPTPASEFIQLSLTPITSVGIEAVRIYDMSGSQVLNTNSLLADKFVDVSNLPTGMYGIQVLTDDGSLIVEKVIIAR